MATAQPPFWDTVDRIRAARPRYRREAYGFVVAALNRAAESLPAERRADPVLRHLTGQELLRGVIAMARDEFGLMAPTVFREWGIREACDVGEIVFELVEAGQLSARPEDRREDFAGGPDLMPALSDGVDLGVPGPRVPEPPGASGPGGPPGAGPGTHA
jgi:uncharacterized repeat protein (TIGR04138 family)